MTQLDQKIDEVAQELNKIGLAVFTEGMTLAKLMRIGADHTEQEIGGFGNGARACGLTAAHIGAEAIRRARELEQA